MSAGNKRPRTNAINPINAMGMERPPPKKPTVNQVSLANNRVNSAAIVATDEATMSSSVATMASGAKLLFVSDLEGCAAGQSRVLCSNEFFEALTEFLEGTTNEVAFLGDYFDKGDLVAQSINNIVALKEFFGDRVHIILGNRDLNKLRLIYEMRRDAQSVGANKWNLWTKFYNELPGATLKDRMKNIHANSMGANYPVALAPGLSDDQANYNLLRAFSEPNAAAYLAQNPGADADPGPIVTEFLTSCRKLFEHGKIVIKSDKFKTLMSHAGGMDPFFFHTPEYYTTVKAAANDGTYYGSIELMRKALQLQPSVTQRTSTFTIATYNSPLIGIGSLFDSTEDPTPNFLLIQALGLKPDGGQHFVSFVQSCDNPAGCKGPVSTDLLPYDQDAYDTYKERLFESNVHFVSAGHVPHCTPIPMIYKRGDTVKPVFIANDTSNGNRPVAISDPTQVPLSYVTADGKAGVGSLPDMGTTTTYKGDATIGDFSVMLGEFTDANMPTFVENGSKSFIKYSEAGPYLVFPARPETTPPAMFKKAQMVAAPLTGGRRRKGRKTQKKAGKKAKKSRKVKRHNH
jgi:hypothetical protein